MKALIIEDEADIAQQIATYLNNSGFVTHLEHEGESGHFEGEEGGYDVILLDVGLPQMDGFSILEKWRAAGVTTPVIILTARNQKMDIVRGLELGADDYITKPFDLDEVVARVRSTLRRSSGRASNLLHCGKVTLDTGQSRVLLSGNYIKLTRTEFLMLNYLFMHQGKTVSANELAEHTYEDFDSDYGIIARHIANIRKKIGKEIIQTDTNRGYYVPQDMDT